MLADRVELSVDVLKLLWLIYADPKDVTPSGLPSLSPFCPFPFGESYHPSGPNRDRRIRRLLLSYRTDDIAGIIWIPRHRGRVPMERDARSAGSGVL